MNNFPNTLAAAGASTSVICLDNDSAVSSSKGLGAAGDRRGGPGGRKTNQGVWRTVRAIMTPAALKKSPPLFCQTPPPMLETMH
jgi:hypothetical protein